MSGPTPVSVASPASVDARTSGIPLGCLVGGEALRDLQHSEWPSGAEFLGTVLSLPVLAEEVGLTAKGQQAGSAPPQEAAPAETAPPAPSGNDRPGPMPNGTGLPTPNALPAAPGSGTGNTASSGGPGCGAAWLPNQYLVIPTAGAEPVRGPLQHVHSADAADPGSSPD
ncbi:hypothetical protein [Arthrobacter sp. U41]|uniref:hypothetical protein n=1 Tax=Arthrobacter sp. U41 TaxID=1849032 RepID=UPI00119CBA03|nr:hypothetical protein [Arthrobacter sp. U41]